MTLGSDGNIWVGVPGKLVKFPPSDPTNSTVYPFTGPAAEVHGREP